RCIAARVPGFEASDESRLASAGEAPRVPPGLVAEGLDAGRESARVCPYAVVAGIDAREELDDLERPDSVGEQVRLDLEVEHVVPLREDDSVVGIEVAADGSHLLLQEPVDLEPAVEEVERRRRSRPRQQQQ